MSLYPRRILTNFMTAKSSLSLCSITFLTAISIAACSSGTTGSIVDSNANLGTSLTLEKAATVPVLDGKATLAGVYVHNNTGKSINGIRYASVDTGSNLDSAHIDIVNLTNCTTIAANSSCLLSFTTPNLGVGQSGSTIIDVSYDGQHSKQLINYRYYSSNDYSGVNFSDGSTSLYGTNDYATVYAFVGKSQSQTKVGFNASNPSLAVSSGLTNGSVDIASSQVIPLEIRSNQDVTSNLVSLTPYTVVSSKQLAKSLQTANLQNQNLQVTISPTQQANLLMSDSQILNATGESTVTITLINNGNQTATNINLTSADSAKISVTSASSNPCTSGSLAAGASCNYKLSLVDPYNNGQSNLNLAYNNSITNIQATQTVYYYNNLAAPMISVVPASSSFTEGINTANSLVFNVQNIGNAPLNNLDVSLSKTLTQAALSQTNDCGSTLKAQASCTITATVSANANIDSGIFYAKLNGNFTNGATTTAYSFISKPVSTTITDSTIATVSSTTPQTAATAVSTATNIALSFSKAMDPTTLNATNIQLQKVSDSSSVPLTFQGVTNNNQTVTFTQTSGTLSDLTNYKVVINPSAIKDYNANPMGASSTQIAASFTTGNSVVNPTISSVNPSTGATNQSTTPTINISFSVPMHTSSLNPSNITLKTGAGVTVAGTSITISNSDQTATVNLNSTPLAETTTYQLVLNEVNLKSASGGALGSNTAYVATSFTTGDVTAPTLSSTIPLNGATGVAVESPISLTFSEAMDTSTLTTTTVKLQRVSDSSDVSLNSPSFSNGNKTVTFQPTANLTAGESYNLVINPNAIKDVAGNAMGAALSQTVSNFAMLKNSATDFILGGQNGITGFISSTSSSAIELATPYASYYGVAQSANGNYIAVGQNGSIMISNTNASTWTAVTSGITDILYAISCGSSNCVAVGEKGKIIYSSDNGQTWKVATSGVRFSLASVSCSGSNCLVTTNIVGGGKNVRILRSVNGGETWSDATPSGFTDNGFNSVSCTASYCVASVHGLYTGSGFTQRNVVFRTTDWGVTWNVYAPASVDTASYSGYLGVSCHGQNCLSSLGGNGVTIYSSDSGVTWIQRPYDLSSKLGGQLSCTANYCIAQNSESKTNLLKTTNFGTSWTNVTTGASQALAGFQCDSTNCMAVGNLSIAMRSTNRGDSWAISNPPPATSGGIGRISCSEHTYCIGIGPFLTSNGHSAIMRSIDAGTSWSAIDSGTTDALFDVSCYGNNCMIVTLKSVLHSTDRGQNWSNITPAILTGNSISVLSCTNHTCVVGGVNDSDYTPFAMYSSDNGGTWLTSTSIQSKDFYPSGLSCSGNICNYVGSDSGATVGVLLRSIDGGAIWDKVSIPSNVSPYSISCSGINCASLGFNPDGGSTVISSSDSGLTWVLSNSLLPSDVYSIACGGANCILVGGTTIVRSSNGGLDWGDPIEQPFGPWFVFTAAAY